MEIAIAVIVVLAVLGFVYYKVRQNQDRAALRNQEVVPAAPRGLDQFFPEIREEVRTVEVPPEVVGDVVTVPVEPSVEAVTVEPVKKVRKARTVKVTSTTKKSKKKSKKV